MSDTAHKAPNFLPAKRWLRHLLFWVFIYFFDVFVFGYDTQNYRMYVMMVLFEMPGQMILAYVFMYSALPRFFQQQYAAAIGIISASFLLCSFMTHALVYFLSDFYPPTVELFETSKLFVRGFYLFANAAIAVIIKLTSLWYRNEIKLQELASSRLESELKMLRDQVNPHFMFNTLNNLYGLIERNPAHAREMIIGLSRILHYMLHETNNKTVSLLKEINCIKDYIELEKIRYPGNLSVSVNHHYETEFLRVVPITLFPFVENAFKHGASETLDHAMINIDFSIYKEEFLFKIENTKRASPSQLQPGGIGLYNVRRRLELIYGPDHALQIIDGHDTFLVILKIKLSRMKEYQHQLHEAKLLDNRG